MLCPFLLFLKKEENKFMGACQKVLALKEGMFGVHRKGNLRLTLDPWLWRLVPNIKGSTVFLFLRIVPETLPVPQPHLHTHTTPPHPTPEEFSTW